VLLHRMTSLHFQITDASSVAVGLARESEVCALSLSLETVAAQCRHPLQEHLHAVWLIEVGSARAVSDAKYFGTRIESYFLRAGGQHQDGEMSRWRRSAAQLQLVGVPIVPLTHFTTSSLLRHRGLV
jgi:hypothetical protein